LREPSRSDACSDDPTGEKAIEATHGVELDFEEGGSGSPHGQFAAD
jgi:hypothetical protein